MTEREEKRPKGHEWCRHTCWDPLPHEHWERQSGSTHARGATRWQRWRRDIWNYAGRHVYVRAVERYATWLALGRPTGKLEVIGNHVFGMPGRAKRRAHRAVRLYAMFLWSQPWPQGRARWTVEEDAAYLLERAQEDIAQMRAELDRRHRVGSHLAIAE